MAQRKSALLYLVTGAMELSWFFAWAMFSGIATMHRPFPFFETIVGFITASFVTYISTGKGWRIIQVLGLQVFGFLCVALLVIHRIYYGGNALYSRGWLILLFAGSRDAQAWFILLMNLLLVLMLWVAGVTFARRAKTYYATCGRFDFGLTAFFVLFLVRLVAFVKGGVRIDDSLSLLFVFPFFLFSLLSIGMVRIESTLPKTFLPGYQGMGVILSFIAIVLVGAGGLVLFFLPALTVAAQMGFRVLKVAGGPVGYVFVEVVRFMFMPRGNHSDASVEASKGIDWHMVERGAQTWWGELLEKILSWGIVGLTLALLLVVAAIAAYYVIRWLFAKTAAGQTRPRPGSIPWRSKLWAVLAGFFKKLLRSAKGHAMAADLYGALLGWARRSGLSHIQTETPLEFGARLHSRFPALSLQIELIISAFNREVYGEVVLSSAQLAATRSAWRELRSPIHWPSRAKNRLLRPSQ